MFHFRKHGKDTSRPRLKSGAVQLRELATLSPRRDFRPTNLFVPFVPLTDVAKGRWGEVCRLGHQLTLVPDTVSTDGLRRSKIYIVTVSQQATSSVRSGIRGGAKSDFAPTELVPLFTS
jgi:hypothetical protein